MKNTEKPSRYLGALSLAAAAALALSACSSGNTPADDASTPAEQNTVTSTPAENTGSPTTEQSPTNGGGDDQSVGEEKFEDVIKTAEAAVSGGKVIDYEYDPKDGAKTYEVDVVDGNNTKHELDIDADATTITEQEQDDALDGDDLKEFQGAKIGIVEAVKAAREKAGADAVVDEVELEWENNKSVWEVKFKPDDSGTKVKVDAETGEVIS